MMTQLNPASAISTVESLFRQNVRTLAHYLYECRGCKEGRSTENWMEAEKMLGENLFPAAPSEIFGEEGR